MTMPRVRYTERSYASILNDLIKDIPAFAPGWTSHGDDEVSIALLQLVAGLVDALHYNLDKQALESFLSTASLRKSIVRLAHLLHYRPRRWSAASGIVKIGITSPLTETVEIPTGSEFRTPGGVYLTAPESVTIPAGFIGTLDLPVYQGRLRETEYTADGSDPARFPLPNERVAEQLLQVSTEEGLWYDAYEHPLDTELSRFYYIDEDEFGERFLVFRSSRGDVPGAGDVVTLEFLTTDLQTVAAGVNLAPPATLNLDGVTFVTEVISGAAEPETTDQIRDRAPASIFARDRAVTAQDFAALAESVPGVKSAAVDTTQTDWKTVTVRIAAADEAEPSEILKEAVRKYLEDRNPVTEQVVVEGAILRPFTLEITLHVFDDFLSSNVADAVDAALSEAYSYERLDIHQAVRLSDLYAVIEAVEGVDYSDITALHWSDEAPTIHNLTPEPSEHPVIGTVSITAA